MGEKQIVELVELLKNYYDGIDDITNYYLDKKLERLKQNKYTDISSEVFSNFTISPLDIDISIEVVDGKTFNNITTQVATFPIESQIGRTITIGVKENNTNTWLGFIRLSSPVSSIKPRNDIFGMSLPLNLINKHIYNGSVIVPVQPFGYNYLGGKLLALICSSNEVKQIYNDKYDTNILMCETTSLYGSTKGSSMYDGLEPYLRFKGLTQSKNTLIPTDKLYFRIRDILRVNYGKTEWNNSLVNPKGSSPKSRELSKIISLLKSLIKDVDKEMYIEFNKTIKEKSKTLQQKRFYTSTFGYTNVVEHLLTGEELDTKNNYKHDLNNLINVWKKKSQKRWNKLNENGILKTELEIYTEDNITNGINFKIIR
jgi:hypothetical protein